MGIPQVTRVASATAPQVPGKQPHTQERRAAVDPGEESAASPSLKVKVQVVAFWLLFLNRAGEVTVHPSGGGEWVGHIFRLNFPIMELDQSLPDGNVDFNNNNNKALAKLTLRRHYQEIFSYPCCVPGTGEELLRTLFLRLIKDFGPKFLYK